MTRQTARRKQDEEQITIKVPKEVYDKITHTKRPGETLFSTTSRFLSDCLDEKSELTDNDYFVISELLDTLYATADTLRSVIDKKKTTHPPTSGLREYYPPKPYLCD